MRSDLNKQLCERERFGSKNKYKAARRRKTFATDDESTRSQESMKFRYHRGSRYGVKDFNENLNPLYGICRKAVGKPWDKFYSELCEVFDMKSVINAHILQHLEEYICNKTAWRDGEIWIHRYGVPRLLKKITDQEFYVDPRDGIIKKNKFYETSGIRKRKARKEKELEEKHNPTVRRLSKTEILHKVDDVWYHFTLVKPTKAERVIERPSYGGVFKNTQGRLVGWVELSNTEKAKIGHVVMKGTMRDELTGAYLHLDDKGRTIEYGSYGSYGQRRWRALPANKEIDGLVRVKKRSANKTELKRAGLK